VQLMVPGHVPPHAGASEMAHVYSEVAQMHRLVPLCCPHIWPEGQVPPHAGTCEMAQVSLVEMHVQ